MRLLRFHDYGRFGSGLYTVTTPYASSPFNRPLIAEEAYYDRCCSLRRRWNSHRYAFASWAQLTKWIWDERDLKRIMRDHCELSEIIVPAGHFFALERQAIFDANAVVSKREVQLDEARYLFREAKRLITLEA